MAGPSRPPQRTSTGSSIESVPLGSISPLDDAVEVDKDEEWKSSGSWERGEAVVSEGGDDEAKDNEEDDEREDDVNALEEGKHDTRKRLVLHSLVGDDAESEDGGGTFSSAHEWQV